MSGSAKSERPVGILVLGMHRSGTSALTRVLNLAGADLPSELVGPANGNLTGHWESEKVLHLHLELLGKLRTGWDDWRPIDAAQQVSFETDRFADAITSFLTQEFAGSRLFVLKDPRICRLMPLWKKIFTRANMEMRAVMPARHPLEVAQSLLERNGLAIERTLMIWLRYVLDAEMDSRDLRRSWTSYPRLLDDWGATLEKIGRELGIAWPRIDAAAADQFIDPSLRHHVDRHFAYPNMPIARYANDAYAVLCDFAENGETPEGLRELDRVRVAFEHLCGAPAETATNIAAAGN